jgi:hypothetical protein
MANITTGETKFQKRTIALACAEQRVTVELTIERKALNHEYLDFVEACKEKSRAKPGKVIIAGDDGVSVITVNGQTWYMRVDRVKRLWFASNGLVEAKPKTTRRALVQSLLI